MYVVDINDSTEVFVWFRWAFFRFRHILLIRVCSEFFAMINQSCVLSLRRDVFSVHSVSIAVGHMGFGMNLHRVRWMVVAVWCLVVAHCFWCDDWDCARSQFSNARLIIMIGDCQAEKVMCCCVSLWLRFASCDIKDYIEACCMIWWTLQILQHIVLVSVIGEFWVCANNLAHESHSVCRSDTRGRFRWWACPVSEVTRCSANEPMQKPCALEDRWWTHLSGGCRGGVVWWCCGIFVSLLDVAL